jgi:hypothetical protein
MGDELQDVVDSIVASTAGLPSPETLAGWTPDLSGDIDIVIRRDGSWHHAGSAIQREGLVRLFASLLRREDDGEYYLVTPVEKWRITVERHPLLAIDCDHVGSNGDGAWYALLNTGGRCRIGGERRLHTDGGEPWLELTNGLSAALTRAAWYRLVDEATIREGEAFILSGGEAISLGRTT